ncbi:MAG: nitrilase [Deltaproteobacteria bacterium]|nr:nitrilase [Deltaproteobacteria bacterium]
MKDIRIAVACMHSEVGDIDRNLEQTEKFVAEASRRGARIVCFPELSLTGYALRDPQRAVGGYAQEEIVERVGSLARQKGIAILAGSVEFSGAEGPYISQVVAGPEGVIGVYRKTHLSAPEKESYLPGTRMEILDAVGVRFGLQLCYEAHFPEISTSLALRGAEAIFMPHASPQGEPGEKVKSWMRHLPARAFDNSLFVAACNQVGVTEEGYSFPGAALVLDPGGHVLAGYAGWEQKLVVADLRGEELEGIRKHRMKYFLPNRRPELYTDLMQGAGRPGGHPRTAPPKSP